MNWLRNHIIYRLIFAGVLFGTILLALGVWLEFARNRLPFELWSFFYIHKIDPLVFVLDLAPLIFGIVGGLLGSQRKLLKVIERSKQEWELIFDSISDPILVSDESGKIFRCNHALVVRLNTSFSNVIGHSLADVFHLKHQYFDSSLQSYQWLGRVYDISSFPIREEGQENKNLIVLHDITDRKQAQTTL